MEKLYKLSVNSLLTLGLIFFYQLTFAQSITHFRVNGGWSGNDANGNAIIKWQMEVCVDMPTAGVHVFSNWSGGNTGTGSGNGPYAGDEDTPHAFSDSGELDNCNAGSWSPRDGGSLTGPRDSPETNAGGNISRLTPNAGLEFTEAGCAQLGWTTYSKDYDSSGDDKDHYVVAEACIGCSPGSLSFNCTEDAAGPTGGCNGGSIPSSTNGNCRKLSVV